MQRERSGRGDRHDRTLNVKRSRLRGKDTGPNHHERFLNSVLTGPETEALAATREHIRHGLINEPDALALEKTPLPDE